MVFLPVAAGILPVPVIKAQSVVDLAVISSEPESPSPGDLVTVRVDTPSSDFNSANFSWVVDGKSRPDISGQGKNIYQYTAGEVGSQSRINVGVNLQDGESATVSQTVSVQGLSLLWFAETYAPLWYKGKALPAPGAVVNVVALPEIIINRANIRPDSLIYHWSLDGVEKMTGTGKTVFRIQTSPDLPNRTYNIDLLVESANKQVRKGGNIQIKNFPAKVLIYPSTPLGGIENRQASETVNVSLNSLLDLVAEPFFFPVSSKSELSYQWSIGTQGVQGNPRNPYLLTVDTGRQGGGRVPISVSIDDSANSGISLSKLINLILP